MAVPSNTPPQIVFSRKVPNISNWATLTKIPLTTADALGKTYTRAHPWLLHIKAELLQQYEWKEAIIADPRMLIDIKYTLPIRSHGGALQTPIMRLQTPLRASSFFSPERRLQWEKVFHSSVFPTLWHIVPPIVNLFHILQCLVTGMLVLVREDQVRGEGHYMTTRALPPKQWVNAHQDQLVDIFGASHYKKLLWAARSQHMSFKRERVEN